MIVASGVILFMIALGFIFTTILQVSLTNVIGVVSPIAFAILLVISVLFIFNLDLGSFFPKVHAPVTKNPILSAFVFGFFFGAIVVPCNPGFIAAFFTRALLVDSFPANMINFISFGSGISFPLIIFSALSASTGTRLINIMVGQKRRINLVAGVVMLAVSLYYLIIVFKVLG